MALGDSAAVTVPSISLQLLVASESKNWTCATNEMDHGATVVEQSMRTNSQAGISLLSLTRERLLQRLEVKD